MAATTLGVVKLPCVEAMLAVYPVAVTVVFLETVVTVDEAVAVTTAVEEP
jgi:hypothetical protein